VYVLCALSYEYLVLQGTRVVFLWCLNMSSDEHNPASDASLTATLIGSVLSLVGSLFILLTYYVVEELRKRPLYRMVFYMGVCDLAHALTYLAPVVAGRLGSDKADAACQIEGAALHFTSIATCSWYFCIALRTFNALKVESTRFDLNQARSKELKEHM
jgi:uncharacterized membrane protein